MNWRLIFWLGILAAWIVTTVGENAAQEAYGDLLTDADKIEINLEKYFLNPMDKDILSCEDGPFIASPIHQYLSKYFIFKVGRVPRWSKLHRRIEERRKKLLTK